MKKTAILTFQNTTNYGAQLQNYALQEYLKQFNEVTVKVINYDNEKIDLTERKFKLSRYKGIKGLIKYLLIGWKSKIKWINFEKFRKNHMNLTKEYNKDNIKQTENKYNYFLVGSDQVWNTDITGNDYNYMLDFVRDNDKKYSYAASIGLDTLTNKKEIISKIKRFKQINVREETAKILLEQNNVKNVKVTVDPVFLIEREEWINKLNLVPKKGNYIFVYMIDDYKENIKKIRKFAKKEHLSVIYINENMFNSFGVKDIKTIDPKEFLEYLYGAKYVITGSFHAVSFSLIFNRDFYYILNKKFTRNSRIVDLMKKLEIKNKDITDKKKIKKANINYEQVNLKIEKEINKSKKILKEMVNEWKE